MRVNPRARLGLVILLSGAVTLTSCAGVDDQSETSSTEDEATTAFTERLDLIGNAVETWANSSSIDEAWLAAEEAANLVVGPKGPGFGDRNGNGVIQGQTGTGLLPGLDGSPDGLALALASNPCIERDVLGGSWQDPQASWGDMLTAIEAWEPGNNTMPTLPSHPMRVVGWATFTLATDSLDTAHEYAGHAQLHVDVSVRALDC